MRISTILIKFFTFLFAMGIIGQPQMASCLPDMAGAITTIKKGDVTIHSYLSPPKGALVNSQIIETKNKIVIVDAQFLRAYAKEMLSYAKSLNKPIDRIIISHSHPDHWFGLEFFKDIPIYSLAETKSTIEKIGDIVIEKKKKRLAEAVTAKKVVPNHIVKEATEIIDGLKYVYSKVSNAEDAYQLLILLPEINTVIAQDLVYNDVHFYLGQNATKEWITALKKIHALDGYDTILTGHGKPAEFSALGKAIDYLEYADRVHSVAKNGIEFKNLLVNKYPNHKLPVLLDLSTQRLYKK